MNELVDIGVNLTNKAFRSDLSAVMQRAQDRGVTRMVVTGTSTRESHAASELAAEHANLLYSTAGVHPHNAKDCDDATLATLRAGSQAPCRRDR